MHGLKVFHLVAWYYPGPPGGSEAYVGAISRSMASAGCSVCVIAPQAGISGLERYEHEGVSVVRYPIPSASTREEVQGKARVRGTEYLHDFLRRERPDIVHFHSFSTGIGIPELRAARATGAKVFFTSHLAGLGYLCKRSTMMRWGKSQCDGIVRPIKCAACVLSDRLPRPLAWGVAALQVPAALVPGRLKTLVGMPRIIADNLARQEEVLQLCDAFFVPTEWAADTMLANGAPEEKVRIMRVGIAHSRMSRKPGPLERPTRPPVRIGYFGRFERMKGVCDLARAFVALPKDLPLRLEFRGPVIPGESSMVRAEAEAIVAGDSRVSFQPAVSPRDALAVLSEYDVLCCPSLCAEAGPMVALEAFACGTPVIATRIGGLAEIVTPGVSGDLVEPGDWLGLSKLLRRIAENPAATVDGWRGNLPLPHTMAQVADDYLTTYNTARNSLSAVSAVSAAGTVFTNSHAGS